MSLYPNDILLLIFLSSDDYITVSNFFVLNKNFYNTLLASSRITFKHKFNVIFNHIFFFLSFMPRSSLKDTKKDVHFLIQCEGNCFQSKLMSREIFTVYRLFLDVLSHYHSEKRNFTLLEHIASFTTIRINKNKLKVNLLLTE